MDNVRSFSSDGLTPLLVLAGFGLVAVLLLPISLAIFLFVKFWKKRTLTNAIGLFGVWLIVSVLWTACVNTISPKMKSQTSESPESIPQQNQIAQAEAGILRLQQRRAKLIPLLEKATAEKDELVAKLQDVGVSKASDLKGNSSARNYASALQKLATDIRNLQLEVSRIDEAITHANGIKRRLEQKDAGVTDEELAALTAESGAMDSPTTGDPASLDAILTQELQANRQPHKEKAGNNSFVGKWEIIEGENKGTVTFTDGGTVQFVWWHSGLERNWIETGKFAATGKCLTIKASGEYGSESIRDFEFLSKQELLLNKPKGQDFERLYGHLKRVQ